MLKLFKYLKTRDWLLFLASVVFIFANVWLELAIPDYMQTITTYLYREGNYISEILKNGGIMISFAVGSAVCAVVSNFFSSMIAADLGRNLRGSVYSKVIGFSNAEIRKFSTASLITRSTNDVTQVQMLISMGLTLAVRAPIMAIMALTKIVAANFEWTIATVSTVAIIVVAIVVIMIVSIPKFKKIQTLTDSLNRVTREGLTGTRVVRAFNAENYQEKKFEKVNNEITKTHLFTSKFMSMLDPMMTLVMSGLPLAIYTIGAILIDKADMATKGVIFTQMITFSAYAIQVVMSFVMLVFIFIMLPRAQVSAKRINEILDTKSSIVDGEGTQKPIKIGEVQFVNVGFKYPDAEEYMLHDISFKVEKGQTVAFIGSTGSGKSTLINLVPRIYDATEGQVIVDGVNVKDYTISQLNDKIGYIAQKAVLFSGTVKSNITMGTKDGGKPSDESIEKAIEISQSNFVNDLPDGINSKIEQGGKNVSGGQKQRLSIARALARNPEILIFDDSFSALDYKTDKLLREALKEKSADTTCLIVAQRIGTIKNADKIIVLENGRIVGEGNHKELMKTCAVYKEIALSQLTKEELENA
ncbi:MAG: ABC transporter ATP-binding protein [Clostridia bacterium]|nr:ABC transporter ATP-binding protein [Clostridia bacterium]